MTIESLLKVGCVGLTHKSVQHGCNGTCVKLQASNPPEVEIWYIYKLKATFIKELGY